MRIQTRDFGPVEVEEKHIITFPQGIFGFETNRQFVMIDIYGEPVLPMWLQNIEEPELCFIIYNPFLLYEGYDPQPDPQQLAALQVQPGQQLLYYAIAVIPEDFKKTTINLKCPLVLNREANLACQVILDQGYPMRQPLFPAQTPAKEAE